MPKRIPAIQPDSEPISSIEVVRALLNGTETEIGNLQQQAERSQQFLNELRAKMIHAQGRLAAYTEVLKALESDAS